MTTPFAFTAKAVTNLALRLSCSELVSEWGYQKTHPEDVWTAPRTWSLREICLIASRAQQCLEGLFFVVGNFPSSELERFLEMPIEELKGTLSAILDQIERGPAPISFNDQAHLIVQLALKLDVRKRILLGRDPSLAQVPDMVGRLGTLPLKELQELHALPVDLFHQELERITGLSR